MIFVSLILISDSYISNVGRSIAKAQITNDGPVILYQPENEYTYTCCGEKLDPDYFQYVMDQAHNAGIVVPMISNDADAGADLGNFVPGSGKGAVDIYGHDDYP